MGANTLALNRIIAGAGAVVNVSGAGPQGEKKRVCSCRSPYSRNDLAKRLADQNRRSNSFPIDFWAGLPLVNSPSDIFRRTCNQGNLLRSPRQADEKFFEIVEKAIDSGRKRCYHVP